MDDIVKKIQSDILRSEVKLSSILLAAKVLAHHLKNPELIAWVNYELDGYNNSDELPDYRIFVLPSQGTFTDRFSIVKNQLIPVSMITDEWLRKMVITYPVQDGIRSIEELANKSEISLNAPWPNEFVQFLNRLNIFNMYCLEVFWVLNPYKFAQILDTVRSRLLDFVLEVGNLDWNIGQTPPPYEQVQRLVDLKIYNNPPGGTMSVFDQRGQNVNYQYNAAGNIHIEAVQNQAELIEELGKLKSEIETAKLAGAIDEDAAIDAEYQVQKAIQAVKKSEPDKAAFMDHIGKAKGLLEDATAATGLVGALLKVLQIAKDLF